jgi:hypothetical protein
LCCKSPPRLRRQGYRINFLSEARCGDDPPNCLQCRDFSKNRLGGVFTANPVFRELRFLGSPKLSPLTLRLRVRPAPRRAQANVAPRAL